MTAGELVEALKDLPEDTEIVLSADAEGNRHSGLDDFSYGVIADGEFYSTDDLGDDGHGVVCLWPT